MFKAKGLVLGVSLALAVEYSPAAMAHPVGWAERLPFPQQPLAPSEAREKTTYAEAAEAGDSVDIEDDALGRYTTDGGKTWTLIREQKGVVERIPSGTNKVEFMAAHRMPPEAEASIVHQVPPAPVIIDGTLYAPEEIHLFDGKQLGFTVGNDGQLHAFTSYAALEDFLAAGRPPEPASPLTSYASLFYEGIGGDGPKHLEVNPGVTWHDLGYAGMDNIFSSMEISEFAANDCTLFEHVNLQGNYFVGLCGEPYPNLGWHNWNDRTSSLVVWPG